MNLTNLTENDLHTIKPGDIIYEAATNNAVRRLQYIGVLTCMATQECKHTFISDYLLSTLLIDANQPARSIPIKYKRLFYTEKEAAERLRQPEALLPS